MERISEIRRWFSKLPGC